MSIYFTQLPRTLVEISGADQRTFLQGLISQDIDKVTEQHSAYGTLLTPQGKYLHDFIIQQNRDNRSVSTPRKVPPPVWMTSSPR